MKRRWVPFLIALACLLAPLSAHADGWHSYRNHALGFGLRYPGGWQVSVSDQLGERLVALTSQGRYSIQISVLKVHPGKNAKQLAKRVLQYESKRGVTMFRKLHWKPTRLGGRFADVAILSQATEGGVALSQAFFLAPGKKCVYQIMIPVNGKKPLHSVSKFPAIYRQILSTWQFL